MELRLDHLIDLGTAGHAPAWRRLPLAGEVELRRHDSGPAGIRRVVPAGPAERSFTIGDVAFEGAA